MCGGISYQFSNFPKKALKKFYSDEEIKKMEKTKKAQSFFWSKNPALPIEINGQLELLPWGNRDKKIKLPQTGWAKAESIEEGKWNWLKPHFGLIPVSEGYEKGVWFEVKGRGFQGLVIEQNNDKRVYMITKPADPNYLQLTKHNRQPVEID